MRSFPFSVGKLLERAIARVRRIYLIRGLAAVGIVWVVGVIAVMAIDARFVIFEDRIRWSMTAGVLLITLIAIFFFVAIPLWRRLDFRRMASVIDQRHPEFDERFSTLVELSESDEAHKSAFSASLFSLVCDLAERDAHVIDIRHEFPLFKALRRLGIFGVIFACLGVGIAVSPRLVGRLFVRAVAPWVDVGNLYSNDVVVKPGDIVALAGTIIHIEAAAEESLHAEPTIRLSRRSGMGWTKETCEPMVNGAYETTADIVEREWRYRVNAGPAVTRYYYVRVSERPKYDSFFARITYPDYTGFSPVVYSNGDVSAIRAIEGTRVNFELNVTEPGTLADFRIANEPVFEYQMQSNRTVNWSLELVNRDGFRSSMGKHPLTSFIDQPPTIVVESPAGNSLKLPPHAKIPVELTASDDVRVLTPQVRYAIDDEEMRELRAIDEFVLSGGNLWRGKAELDLTRFDLTMARKIRFDFVATDNCPEAFGGPHVVTSSVINVNLEYQQWGFEVADIVQQKKEADALIREAMNRLSTAERLARELSNEFNRNGPVGESSERKNESAAHEVEEAHKRVDELRNRFADDERFAPLVKPIENMVAEKLAPAAKRIEHSPFTERNERSGEMLRAANELQEARDEMNELSKRLAERFEKVEALEKAKDLAARQDALAKTAKQILSEKPKDPAKLEAWKRLEQEAMRRVDELSRNLPDADFAEARRKMETASRKFTKLAQDINNAAERLVEEQRANAQREQAKKQEADRQAQELAAAAADQQRAAQALQNNDFNAAQAAQRSAEDHLERAESMEPVKALQQMASEATRTAQKAPQTAEKTATAKSMQKLAADALAKEQAVRAAMAKGEMSESDLAALENELRDAAQTLASQKTAAAKEASSKTLQAARNAIGSEDQDKINELANAALEAKRDELGAVLEESKLNNNDALADAAREALDGLDAIEAANAEDEALEKKILSGQQQAIDAMNRNDRVRAANLQREIARAQARAAESPLDSDDADDAREDANEAQDDAQEEFAEANGNWNDKSKAKAIAAQEKAMNAERAAQGEARAARTIGRIAAAGKSVKPSKNASPGEEPADVPSSTAAKAAQDAADAMQREVNAQATALGMSRQSKDAKSKGGKGRGKKNDDEQQLSLGGGGIEDEVAHLAKELNRKDDPNFFSQLFKRLGWFKIRGLSKDGIDAYDLKDVPREYRDLVRRYFLKLTEENH